MAEASQQHWGQCGLVLRNEMDLKLTVNTGKQKNDTQKIHIARFRAPESGERPDVSLKRSTPTTDVCAAFRSRWTVPERPPTAAARPRKAG